MKRLAGVFLFAAITLSFAFAAPVPPRSQLRTNEYTWHPQTSPQGPVLMVISLPEQQAYVYRNGVLIGRTTISSGRAGHRTPTGVFTVLEKQRKHYSNIYKGAAMPYHGAADLERDRAARRKTAGLSRFPWMRPPAEGIFRTAFRRDQGRHDRRGRE